MFSSSSSCYHWKEDSIAWSCMVLSSVNSEPSTRQEAKASQCLSWWKTMIQFQHGHLLLHNCNRDKLNFLIFFMLVGLLPVTAGVVNTNGFPVLVVHVILFKMATCHYIHVTGIRRICSSFQILLINNGLLCTLSSHYLSWGSHSYDHHGKQSTNSRFLLRNRVVYHKFVASSCYCNF